jgi:hypothetical protein
MSQDLEERRLRDDYREDRSEIIRVEAKRFDDLVRKEVVAEMVVNWLDGFTRLRPLIPQPMLNEAWDLLAAWRHLQEPKR